MKLFLSIRKINELIHSFEGPGLEILEKNNNIKLIVLVFKKLTSRHLLVERDLYV